MKLEELLSISVDDDRWLEVTNGTTKAKEFIDREILLDYIAMKADNAEEDDEEDEVALEGFYSFDAKDCLGMSAESFIDEYIYDTGLEDYFIDQNIIYCEEHNLCRSCRTKLIDDDGSIECPHGC